MKSGYRQLGEFIRQVDVRNKEGKEENLLGVSVNKKFIPSIANTVGTDFTKYKVVKNGQFTYIPDTSRRGDKIGIALLKDYDEGLVSNVYTVFEVIDENKLLPDYLMLWFSRPEFDRYARFKSHGSVREIFDWDEMCKVELPVPDIEEQKKIVHAYKVIEDRINLKKRINENLEETALTLFKKIGCLVSNGAKLSDYCEFQEGYVNPPQEYTEYFGGDIMWLRGVDFTSQIISTTSRTLTQSGFESAGKSALMFNPKTVVITKSGTIGKLGIITNYMCGNRATINIRPNKEELLSYVYFFLKSIQHQFYEMAVGSAQVNLYVSVLKEIPCPKYEGNFIEFANKASIILNSMFSNSDEISKLIELQTIIISGLNHN